MSDPKEKREDASAAETNVGKPKWPPPAVAMAQTRMRARTGQ